MGPKIVKLIESATVFRNQNRGSPVRERQLSGTQVLWWTALGVGSGLAAGFALSEWVGGVNRTRVQHAAARLGRRAPAALTPAAAARAVTAAIGAEPRLAELTLRAVPGGRGAVELHGWVPTRAARALAARVARAVPGVDRIINSILVRGEDDRPSTDAEQITDQSA
jgi:hypothetical protein